MIKNGRPEIPQRNFLKPWRKTIVRRIFRFDNFLCHIQVPQRELICPRQQLKNSTTAPRGTFKIMIIFYVQNGRFVTGEIITYQVLMDRQIQFKRPKGLTVKKNVYKAHVYIFRVINFGLFVRIGACKLRFVERREKKSLVSCMQRKWKREWSQMAIRRWYSCKDGFQINFQTGLWVCWKKKLLLKNGVS